MRETSRSTNVHCPTDPAEHICWFDLDLGFPGGVRPAPVSIALLNSLLSFPPGYGIAKGIDECLCCATFASACQDHPALTEGGKYIRREVCRSEKRAVAQKLWKWVNGQAGIAVWVAPRTQQTVACRHDVTAAIRAQMVRHDGCSIYRCGETLVGRLCLRVLASRCPACICNWACRRGQERKLTGHLTRIRGGSKSQTHTGRPEFSASPGVCSADWPPAHARSWTIHSRPEWPQS